MKKIPEADVKVIESITNQLINNVNLQIQTDQNEESKPFSIKITKEDIKEETGRKVIRDSVLEGYSKTIKEKFPDTQVSIVQDEIVVSVPAYGAIDQPMTLSGLSSTNQYLEEELKEMNSEDED